MTTTKNEFGQMNMWAKEPAMYMTKEDLERYGIEPYAERAQRANSRWAMIGIVSGIGDQGPRWHLTSLSIP